MYKQSCEKIFLTAFIFYQLFYLVNESPPNQVRRARKNLTHLQSFALNGSREPWCKTLELDWAMWTDEASGMYSAYLSIAEEGTSSRARLNANYMKIICLSYQAPSYKSLSYLLRNHVHLSHIHRRYLSYCHFSPPF